MWIQRSDSHLERRNNETDEISRPARKRGMCSLFRRRITPPFQARWQQSKSRLRAWEALNQWSNVFGEKFWHKARFEKRRNALCISSPRTAASGQKTRRSTSACAPVVPLYKKDGRPLVPSQQAPGLIGRSHAGGAQVVLTAGVKRDIYCNHRLLPKRRQIQTKSAQPSTQPHGYTPPMRDTRSTPVTAWVQGSARQI